MTVRSSRDDTDVRRVLDGSEDSCGQDNLLVGLADVDNIDTWRIARMSSSSKRAVRDDEDADRAMRCVRRSLVKTPLSRVFCFPPKVRPRSCPC